MEHKSREILRHIGTQKDAKLKKGSDSAEERIVRNSFLEMMEIMCIVHSGHL